MENLLRKIEEVIRSKPEEMQAYEDMYYICLEVKKTDVKTAVKYLKRLSSLIEKTIKSSNDDAKVTKLYFLHKKVLLAAAFYDFESYLLYVEFNRSPSKKFYVPRRRIMKPIVNDLQDIADDKLDLLTISMPPGTGKSTLGIFYLTWVMGRDPDGQSIASAHSDTLTKSFYEGVKEIITDREEYLWGDVFPGVILASTDAKNENIDLRKKHRFATLQCRAIGASLTGATRCDKILYADDLVSGIEEAMSKERLDKLWLAYTNDLKSRKKMGAKEIHISTRWSVHDVVGRLQKKYGDSPRAKFHVMPALDENGESNFNYDYGVGFSKEYFRDMQSNLDDASFKALYMNQPIEREGLLYHEDELQRYFELPSQEPDAILAVCDTKDKGKDYCVMPIAFQYGKQYFIEDFICDNSNPDVVEARLVTILLKYHVNAARFESNSAGGKIAENVQKEVAKHGGITQIVTKFTTANKETKIITASGYVKEHFLFKDRSLYDPQSDYGKAMNFLCSYTMTGKNTHDDVPDALSMLVDYIDSFRGAEVTVIPRPW